MADDPIRWERVADDPIRGGPDADPIPRGDRGGAGGPVVRDHRRRVGRILVLNALVVVLAWGTFAVLDLLGLRGTARLSVYFVLTVGIIAGMFYWTARRVLARGTD